MVCEGGVKTGISLPAFSCRRRIRYAALLTYTPARRRGGDENPSVARSWRSGEEINQKAVWRRRMISAKSTKAGGIMRP